jgi:protein tyrosine phosphatase (PTP) superfamily phosphohydrolase (DUF442 family)
MKSVTLRSPFTHRLAVVATLLLTAGALLAQEPEAAAEVESLRNPREPLPGVRTGGAPVAAEGIERLAAEGVRTYVDLRRGDEVTPEFRAAVAAAGIELVELPIAGEADLDLALARRLDALLDDPKRRPMVVGCSSGNRSGALLAVHAFWLEGAPAERALELGKAAGLTRLEPSVRLLLGLPPLPPPDGG